MFSHHATLYQHLCQDNFKPSINTARSKQKQSMDAASPDTSIRLQVNMYSQHASPRMGRVYTDTLHSVAIQPLTHVTHIKINAIQDGTASSIATLSRAKPSASRWVTDRTPSATQRLSTTSVHTYWTVTHVHPQTQDTCPTATNNALHNHQSALDAHPKTVVTLHTTQHDITHCARRTQPLQRYAAPSLYHGWI